MRITNSLEQATKGVREICGNRSPERAYLQVARNDPFETLLDCEKAQHELLAKSRAGSPQAGAQCVATDDPRLK